MQEELINRVLQEVMRRVGSGPADEASPPAQTKNNPFSAADLTQLTEFVGVGPGDTQGIVIANLDPIVHELMDFEKRVPGNHRRTRGSWPPVDGSR